MTKMTKPLLVIDDDSSVLRLLDRYFTKKGRNIIIASNGKAALDILNHNKEIGAVLSDLQMPEMSGVELTQEIRKSGSFLPVYIMTGFPEEGEVERLKEFEVAEIFRKPLDLKSIEERIFNDRIAHTES